MRFYEDKISKFIPRKVRNSIANKMRFHDEMMNNVIIMEKILAPKFDYEQKMDHTSIWRLLPIPRTLEEEEEVEVEGDKVEETKTQGLTIEKSNRWWSTTK